MRLIFIKLKIMIKLRPNRTAWRISIAIVAIIILITYTPAVIPAGKIKPTLLGMPYSLWMGILLTIVLVTLTYIGSKIFPSQNEKEEKK